MRLAGPLRVVVIVLTAGLTWILVSIMLGTQSGFSRLQQLLSSPENPPTPEPRPKKYKCGLPRACPDHSLAFRITSGAANVIGPKICLEDKMLMSSVKNNVGRGLNIALVNGVNGELIDAKFFDMWAGGLGPQYLTERLSQHEPTRTLRSTSKVLLRVPTPREARWVATRERAFSVVAPQLWNDVPKQACLAPTLLSFRCQVKTYLFSQAVNNMC